MNIRVNRRIEQAEHSPTLEIHQRVSRLREEGGDVVHFGFGESPFPVPPVVVAELTKHAGDSRYLPSQGLPALREGAATYLGWRFGHDADASRIIVGPGSKELIFDCLLALDGDLILPSPSWVSYGPQGRLLGKRVIWVRPDPGNGYRMSADDFEAACKRSRTKQKITVLNSPCNPTGAVYSQPECEAIARVARRHNVVIISDEIYAEITFARKRYTSIATFCPERTLVTTGLSKGFCAGGHRLGVLSVPEAMAGLVQHLVCIASETFSCVSAPVQHAAVVAFSRDRSVRDHVRDTVAIHRMTGEYLWRGMTELGLRCPKPEGAFYLFPDFSPFARGLRCAGIRTDGDLCSDFLGKQGVAMLPGAAFGVPGGQLAVRLASVDYDGRAVLRAYRRKRPRTAAQKRTFVEEYCSNLAGGLRRIGEYLDGMG